MRFRRSGFHDQTDRENIFLQEDLPVERAEKVEVIRLGGSSKTSEGRRSNEGANHENTNDEKSPNWLELEDFAPSLPELEPALEICSFEKERPDQAPDLLEFEDFLSFQSGADEIAYIPSEYILASDFLSF